MAVDERETRGALPVREALVVAMEAVEVIGLEGNW